MFSCIDGALFRLLVQGKCCKHLSPLFSEPLIERMFGIFGMKLHQVEKRENSVRRFRYWFPGNTLAMLF